MGSCPGTHPVHTSHFDFATLGGVQVPSTTAAFGQYARMYSEKSASFGAGSQLASFSAPGDSLCTYNVRDPSSSSFNDLFLVPSEYRLSGFGAKRCSEL